MKTNIGVIGIGNFGTLHIEALLQNPEVSIISIASRNENKLKKYSEKYNIPKYFLDIDKMFENSNLDGVIIATSEDSHYELTKKQFYQIYMFFRKTNLPYKRRSNVIFRFENKSSNYILPGHILRYDSAYSNLKNIIDNPATGKIQSIRVKRNVPIERFSLHSRTHPIFMALAHDIDIIVWLTKSSVKKVYGIQKKTNSNFTNPDIVFGVAEMENGVICNLETQWRLPNETGKYLETEVEIMTENGNIKLNSPGDNLSSILNGKTQGYDITLWPYVNGKYSGALVNEHNHFIDLINNRTKTQVVTIDEAINGIKFCLMLIESCENEKIIYNEGD